MTDEHAMKVWREAFSAWKGVYDPADPHQAAAAIIAADRAELVERVKVLEGESAVLDEARGDPVAKVVAWLRRAKNLPPPRGNGPVQLAVDVAVTQTCLRLADMLERGEHLK